MHEAALARAAIPEPTRILRLQLRPYSIGHELALHRRSNAFVKLSQPDFQKLEFRKRKEAMIQAVLVCSRDWLGNQRDAKGMRLWNFVIWFCGIEDGISRFEEYQAYGRNEFKADLPHNAGPVRFIGAPYVLRLYQFITRTVPHNEIFSHGRSVWDFPFALAAMMFQAEAEAEGSLEIYNQRLKAHDDYVAEEEAKRIAEEEAAVKAGTLTILNRLTPSI